MDDLHRFARDLRERAGLDEDGVGFDCPDGGLDARQRASGIARDSSRAGACSGIVSGRISSVGASGGK
jgi:hypothetical protein